MFSKHLSVGKEEMGNEIWESWQLSIVYDIGLYWDFPPLPQEFVKTKQVRTKTP